jgi:hypothetical protein
MEEMDLKSFTISSKQFQHVFGFTKTDNKRFWDELAKQMGVESPEEKSKTTVQNAVNMWLKNFSDNVEEMPNLTKKWTENWTALKEQVILEEGQKNHRGRLGLRSKSRDMEVEPLDKEKKGKKEDAKNERIGNTPLDDPNNHNKGLDPLRESENKRKEALLRENGEEEEENGFHNYDDESSKLDDFELPEYGSDSKDILELPDKIFKAAFPPSNEWFSNPIQYDERK